ncbi:MAG: hypothetical protein JRN26_07290 [Nitrososphaerota archaeon]|jgi:hypothetical protein|nr:hypothetical protein [Nitrososphaerota archaeon]MDG6927884.1 hypothetical protein [Nitrososphaerota archaeon]MDG6931029.1 hypothetical protein [Nitrososphaerota archaeon]MDG6932111.1 hypothetical protein [Nitrososphaerota archaeon]MDG6936666.1 hypothetical protein [Nitrososphaerota archaeon]
MSNTNPDSSELELRNVPPRVLAIVNIVIGILLLISVPIAMISSYNYYPHTYNYLDVGISSIIAIIIIIVALLDYASHRKGKGSIIWPAILFIFSFILMFQYIDPYDFPALKTYHLYIIPVFISHTPYYVSYHVYDMLFGISLGFGIFLLVTSIWEIAQLAKSKNA